MSNPVFSPDSNHIAYIAKKNNRFFVVFDGKERDERYDEIAKLSLVFTADSNHLAFSARNAGKWFVVIDGIEMAKYDFIIDIKANPEKTDAIRYLALKDNTVYLIEEKAINTKLDEVTRQKLQALESAHDAGILNDEEYNRKKAELLSQSAITPQTTASSEIPSVISLPQKKQGKTYNSSNGFSFWYPDDWNIKDEEGSIQIIPSNPTMSGGVVVELYYVIMEDIIGTNISQPYDPQIIEYLSGQLQSLSPNLQLTGKPTPVKTNSGDGTMLDWEVTSPTGDVVMARAFVNIINEKALIVLGMGLKNTILSRDQVIRQIFTSLGIGKAQMDINKSESIQPVSSSQIGAGEVGDPNWGFKFTPPESWKYQKNTSMIILGHDTIAGMILVMPHISKNIQELQSQMQDGLQEDETQLMLTGTLKTMGDNILYGDYNGVIDGQQVKARGIGTLSQYGGGAIIIAVTTPDKYSIQLINPAETIAKSMQYFKVDVSSELMQHFVGTWTNYTKNTSTQITLSKDGSFSENYEASYSGNFSNQYGNDMGGWGTARQDQSQGRWTVRGDRQQGTIIITKNNGEQITLEYKVHVEKGETFWNEYLFNGDLYGKK
ncbi:TPA: SHOCT domain-containing protein [bacterium]|nr:SHOCT domain-containing protein [bacterium]